MTANLCANFRSLGKIRPILGQLPPTIAPAQSPRQENPQLLTSVTVITDQNSFLAEKSVDGSHASIILPKFLMPLSMFQMEF